MKLLDANIVLYAYNADAPQHQTAAKWLTSLFNSGEPVVLPWVTIWAFIRISTNVRIWTNPLPAKKAFAIVNEWLEVPSVKVVHPGPRHAEFLERLVVANNAAGSMLTDAVLAALAMEYGATVSILWPKSINRAPVHPWGTSLRFPFRAR